MIAIEQFCVLNTFVCYCKRKSGKLDLVCICVNAFHNNTKWVHYHRGTVDVLLHHYATKNRELNIEGMKK